MALTLTRGGRRVSHQPLRHKMPVSPVEELLLHMIVQAGAWRMWRVFIVEHELGRFVLPRLQEAHHLTIIGCFPIARLFTPYFRNQTMGHHLCLNVRRRAALGDWPV